MGHVAIRLRAKFLAAVRVRNWASPDGDKLPVIFPKFYENPMQSTCLQNGPFSRPNPIIELSKFWVKIRAAGGGRNDAENGHASPRLGLKNMASPDGDRLPIIFSKNLGKYWAIHASPKWPHFCDLSTAEDCPIFW